MAQLLALLAAKLNWDPFGRRAGAEERWDAEEGEFEPVVVEVESEEEVTDTDVDFGERTQGGRMDMSTGKMVFD
jgi:hypothetical protein